MTTSEMRRLIVEAEARASKATRAVKRWRERALEAEYDSDQHLNAATEMYRVLESLAKHHLGERRTDGEVRDLIGKWRGETHRRVTKHRRQEAESFAARVMRRLDGGTEMGDE